MSPKALGMTERTAELRRALRRLPSSRRRMLRAVRQRRAVDEPRDATHAVACARLLESDGLFTAKLRYLLGNRGVTKRSAWLPGGAGNEQPADAGERGDDQDRGSRRSGIGSDTGDQRAEHEAEVAPEAVDADNARPVTRLARVRDSGDQLRVDHRRAYAQQQRRRERRRAESDRADWPGRTRRRESRTRTDQRRVPVARAKPAARCRALRTC